MTKKNYEPALDIEKYSGRVKSEKKRQSAGGGWWQHPAIVIGMVILLSAMDAITLFNTLDAVITENPFLSRFMTAVIAVMLNFIPLMVAHYYHQMKYKLSHTGYWMFGTLLAVFVLLFSITFYLRWVTQDLLNAGASTISSTTEGVIDTSEQNTDVNRAVTLLLGLSPLITSVINFFLGLIVDDPVKKELNTLYIQKIELQSKKQALACCQKELEMLDFDAIRDLDTARYNAVLAGIAHAIAETQLISREELAEYLKDPNATTRLIESQKEIVGDTNEGGHENEEDV